MPIQDEEQKLVDGVTDITDHNGNALSYTYGTSPLNQEVLTEITDTAGRKLFFLNYGLVDGFSRTYLYLLVSESVGIKLDFLYYDKSTFGKRIPFNCTHLGCDVIKLNAVHLLKTIFAS